MRELVSVILPTLDEAERLPRAIRSARGEFGVEIIVADGGSADGTAQLAHRMADRVVHAPRCRAAQLNAGAAAAHGSILLFLHADGMLAPGSLHAIRHALADPRILGGAFTLRIGSAEGALGLISWSSNVRSRVLGLPYGDQALFVRAPVFESLGGFRSMPMLEDVEFVQRLRRIGRLALIDLPVRASARRWRDHGMLRTSLAGAAALTLFQLGVAPHRIRSCYDRILAAPRG